MTEGNYAPINGLNLYYEIHGEGEPLILIHGGFGVTGMFQALIPALAATCQVIAIELQAHGHTADIDRPLSCEAMGDDVAALIAYLGYASADVFGYSLGGVVALQAAIRHPERVRKLIVLSAPYKSDGWYESTRQGMAMLNAEDMSNTIMHEVYLQTAPRPQDWPVFIGKMHEMLGKQTFDWTAGVAALNVPTLIIVGDGDNVPPSHAVEMFALLGGGMGDGGMGQRPASQLAILPGIHHYEIFTRVDLLMPLVTPFLNGSGPAVVQTPDDSGIPQQLRR